MEVVPISAELWGRVRRFDPHCKITLQRTRPDGSLPGDRRRVWHCSMSLEPKHWDFAKVETTDLNTGLEHIVTQGEARGWGRERPPAHVEPPIDVELWTRMVALDASCWFAASRCAPDRPRPGGPLRVWWARYMPVDGKVWDSLQAERATLGEAIRAIIGKAESGLWEV